MSATGIDSRKSAMPFFNKPGPAARAPDKATRRPAPLKKSRWNGKKPEMIGTKSTPPPTPPNTATMPIRNVTINNDKGHTHHGTFDDAAAAGAEVATVDAATAGTEVASVDAIAWPVIAKATRRIDKNKVSAADPFIIVLYLPYRRHRVGIVQAS